MTHPRPTLRGGLPRHFAFDTRNNVIRTCLAVCLLAALASLLLGQDANWDLRNYHVYNGWAALHGRLSVDLAPAQLQSYFVPWLDAGYYLLAVKGSPVLAGALLGALHGLAFAAAAAVAWLALEGDPRRGWIAPLLGLAGCCDTTFWSELGNTMGDDTTAALVIGALAFALWAGRTNVTRAWLWSGALMGLALAFKLTNMPYALGLGFAALASSGSWTRRIRGAALMTLAALVVFAIVAGPWFWQVYQQFGNPLFPQLNGWFHAPLALPVAVADTRWLPRNIGEALIWPLLITVNPGRINELPTFQLILAALYLLTILFVAQRILRWAERGRAGLPAPNPAAARMLAAFVTVSFVAWMGMFSIHRYLVVLELVAPLALWLLARRVLPAPSAEKWACGLVLICAIVLFAAMVPPLRSWTWALTWGHEDWTRYGFGIDKALRVNRPETATVLMTGPEPQAWRIPFLPRQAAYVGISTNFPSSPGYDVRVRQIAAERGGTVYALFPGALDGALCHCSLNPYAPQASVQNRALIDEYDALLHTKGWQLKRETCAVHASYIGQGNYPFHWCKVALLPSP